MKKAKGFFVCTHRLKNAKLVYRARISVYEPIHEKSMHFLLLFFFYSFHSNYTRYNYPFKDSFEIDLPTWKLGNLDSTFWFESLIKIQESSSESWIRWIQKYHRSPNRILRSMAHRGFECWVDRWKLFQQDGCFF